MNTTPKTQPTFLVLLALLAQPACMLTRHLLKKANSSQMQITEIGLGLEH